MNTATTRKVKKVSKRARGQSKHSMVALQKEKDRIPQLNTQLINVPEYKEGLIPKSVTKGVSTHKRRLKNTASRRLYGCPRRSTDACVRFL